MKPRLGSVLPLALILVAGAMSVPAQRTDYLTPAEVIKIRDTMKPQKRIKLFLDIAGERLASLEGELRSAGQHPEKHSRELTVKFDHYLRALDDVAGHLEMWLERGGVDLRKLRSELPAATRSFLLRLHHIQDSNTALRETDLHFDLEDSIEVTEEVLAMGKDIPSKILPPRLPSTERAVKPAEAPPTPGKPTMRRPGEDASGQKPKDKPPQP